MSLYFKTKRGLTRATGCERQTKSLEVDLCKNTENGYGIQFEEKLGQEN